ncbi:polysaccharide deacetylase family protein [Lysobacter antibioticus]|uniref:Polysaccharide deacetylase family protein n=1 Tax=Lysobacter antibioticus TaxID=84531 RepID=A0A0S2FCU1_LYSAN|nr:polysaccharide deacetylase family protein [Lysobacter antibioticus]ALN81367.1 polysaccharide deacetylase family protein [Lysobacter antibioticus]
MDYHDFLADYPRTYLGRGSPDARRLALTFDDGPGRATPALLSALAELQVAATFFCTGEAARAQPALIERILREGHEIGNHSLSHADARSFGIEDWIAREIHPAAAALCDAGLSDAPRLFRPAYGEIAPGQVDALGRLGYTVVGWSVDPRDWLEPEAPGYVPCVVESVLARIHPGAIVLLHDGDDEHGRARHGIVEIVRRLVPALREQGYGFARVGEFLSADATSRRTNS